MGALIGDVNASGLTRMTFSFAAEDSHHYTYDLKV
jgi:hypothetical protein